jgi:hypothetical protein
MSAFDDAVFAPVADDVLDEVFGGHPGLPDLTTLIVLD